jgi:hypothetical protein
MAVAKVVIALAMCFVALAQSLTIKDFPSNDIPGLALPDDWDYEEEAATPPCFPAQWQGNVSGQVAVSGGGRGDEEGDVSRRGGGGGRGKLKHYYVQAFVDQTNKRVAIQMANATCSHNQTILALVTFTSAATGADLYIINLSNKSCTHKSLTNATFRAECLPVNATLRGSISLGLATGGLPVQVWKFWGKTNNTRGRARAFISGVVLGQAQANNILVPVLISETGFIRSGPHDDDDEVEFDETTMEVVDKNGQRRQGRGFVAGSSFHDLQASIADPSIFTPPSYCTSGQENQSSLNEEDIPDALFRFVSF